MIRSENTHGGLLDENRLFEWIDTRIPGRGKLAIHPIPGGSSNLMFRLERAGELFVLRRPPRQKYDATSHDLSREIKLLTALGKTAVPHPRLITYCNDPAVIGAPFIVMAYIEGFSPIGTFPEPFESDSVLRGQVGFRMVETLASLVAVDWREVGLESFGKPEGFLERQVDRWMSQLARYQLREIPLLEQLAQWLRDNRPVQVSSGLMHGDYSFPNVLFARNLPVRIAAIVDWESCTIGDPLLDLGHLLAGWCDPGEDRTYLRNANWRDMPNRAELAARYAELTGLPIDRIQYYRALALFKLAIILEGAYARVLKGQSDYAPHRTLEQRVPQFIQQAWSFTHVE